MTAQSGPFVGNIRQRNNNLPGPLGLDVLNDEERFQMDVYQAFLVGARGYWRDDVYRTVVEFVGDTKASPDEIEKAAKSNSAYQLYAWMERHLQQFRYGGRDGVMTVAARKREEFERLYPPGDDDRIAAAQKDHIDELDVHQHPGGLEGGVQNAIAHEWYQTGPSFSGVGTDTMVAQYVDAVSKRLPQNGHVVDLGCTLGRMTLALKEARPDAIVEGVDISEPVIRLARVKAAQRQLDINFILGDAAQLPHAAAHVDVAASHWMFHELPHERRLRVLDEMSRVVKPGGHMVIFDMYRCPGGRTALWFQKGFAVRNNEPFAIGFAEMDIDAELKKRGFRNIEIKDFNPEDGSIGTVSKLPPRRTHFTTLITAQKA